MTPTRRTGFEEELIRFPQPFWNHKGGPIAFGPDGMLYIALGDGGAGNDPLRQRPEPEQAPLARSSASTSTTRTPARRTPSPRTTRSPAPERRPEIYAYGFRNPWRIAFDSKTGALWCSDVGQNLWKRSTSSKRAATTAGTSARPASASAPRPRQRTRKLLDPIWEYDHQVGKSITGGNVYRGSRVKELAGKYVYADYVSGKVWALDYDEAKKSGEGNYSIPRSKLADHVLWRRRAGGHVLHGSRAGRPRHLPLQSGIRVAWRPKLFQVNRNSRRRGALGGNVQALFVSACGGSRLQIFGVCNACEMAGGSWFWIAGILSVDRNGGRAPRSGHPREGSRDRRRRRSERAIGTRQGTFSFAAKCGTRRRASGPKEHLSCSGITDGAASTSISPGIWFVF